MRSSQYSGSSRYVGHVGTLAVAVGLGAAVVTGRAWHGRPSPADGSAASSSASVGPPAAAVDKPTVPTPAKPQTVADQQSGAATAGDDEDAGAPDTGTGNEPASADDGSASEPSVRPARTRSPKPDTVDSDVVAPERHCDGGAGQGRRRRRRHRQRPGGPVLQRHPATPSDSPAQWREAAVARREIGVSPAPITTHVNVGLTDQVITGGVSAKDATATNP